MTTTPLEAALDAQQELANTGHWTELSQRDDEVVLTYGKVFKNGVEEKAIATRHYFKNRLGEIDYWVQVHE